jgi:hypothetical protein
LPLSTPAGPTSQRHLPGVHDGAVDHTVIGGRNFQHHGTGILGVEERHQIDHVGIRCERLVLPVWKARPVDDLVGLAAELEHLLVHEVVIDRRHAPDDRLDSAPFDRALRELLWPEVLRFGSDQGHECSEEDGSF